MGNPIAYLMLALWPAVCVMFFTRFSVERALIWSIVGAYMVLPPLTEFDLPLIPSMNKFSIASVSALIILVGILGLRPSFMPRHKITRIAIAAMLLGTVATVLTNGDPVVIAERTDLAPIVFPSAVLPGLRLIDMLSVLAEQLIFLIPLLLARQYLSTDAGLRELMFATVIAGLIYSIPALIEIRLSPQLNQWIYGFFQHSFEQMVRNGSFRPIVFMPHALWLALFFTMAMAASLALIKTATHETRWRYILAALYMCIIIYLCKSLATQLYALMLVPLILYGSARWQFRVAFVLAIVAVTYPMLRSVGLIPLEFILAQAEAINPDRAQSLGFRFQNEEVLLNRAAERTLFGWGGWGRNLIYDSESGDLATIPDGRWIIVFGTFGWVGYLSQMGLVALPLILVGRYARKHPDEALSPMIGPLCLMLGVTMVDMLLNDTLVPMTMLIVGAILGYAERLRFNDPSARQKVFPDGPLIGRSEKVNKRTVL